MAAGGGVEVAYQSDGPQCSTVFTDTGLTGNALHTAIGPEGAGSSENGGGLHISHFGNVTGTRLLMRDVRVERNRGGSWGGGICHQTLNRGVTAHLERVSIVGNDSPEQGGGLWVEQLEANAPMNLGMVAHNVGSE